MEVGLPRHPEQGPRPKKARTGEKKDRDNKKASFLARSQQYTPLNMPLEQVLMQIKDDPSLKWPKKMKGIPKSAIGTSIVTSIEIMDITRTSVLI